MTPKVSRNVFFTVGCVLGVLALLGPFSEGEIHGRLGVLLIVAATVELTHGFLRATWDSQRAAWGSASISFLVGMALINAPGLTSHAFQWLMAVWFAVDVFRNLGLLLTAGGVGSARTAAFVAAIGNAVAVIAILLLQEKWVEWTLAAVTGVRIFFSAWSMRKAALMSPQVSVDTIVSDLGFDGESDVNAVANRLAADETGRTRIDRGWICSFLMTLLAIHVGRMGFDRTILGLLSPGFAVLGDLFAALLISFLVIIPAIVVTGRLLRSTESTLWRWSLSSIRANRTIPRVTRFLLTIRMRQSIRLRLARCSLTAAVSRGLQYGLPVAAVIAATAPMWGMSWYFDTENWAAGVWNSWAAHRTDSWRAAMIEAVSRNQPSTIADQRFRVTPPMPAEPDDFAFLVIGDPGEGDASQHSLRSQFLRVVQQDLVKFVVISSDVVYPTGAMKDYESRFWLPFMGTEKPVYAIPGNHDWYDALEGFAATFLTPEAARAAMNARVEADNRISSTTEFRIDELIRQATALRNEYRVPTQHQEVPFFQFHTEQFALFAVDTGVTREIDAEQRKWLEAGLKAASGKTTMVILGHPFFAGGRNTVTEDSEFEELQKLFRKHQVSIVMAGDTHDLEYYRELSPSAEPSGDLPVMHHFVNGGGGAYLSFGTSLDWPADPVTDEWAFYPATQQVKDKIEATVPVWKRPVWVWTKKFKGWPFSAEWLSAAFDVNVAPFYQSFMEVRVNVSQGVIRLIPHGVHGRLRYRDLEQSGTEAAPQADTEVEWLIPMKH